MNDNQGSTQPEALGNNSTAEGASLSDNKKLNRKLKFISIFFISGVLLWILLLNPMIKFKHNEQEFTKAAEKYFDMYTSELPTGERISTISLTKLYERGFLKEDFYIPYRLLSKKTCDITESWVKVKKVDGDYKYYTYLDCGIYQSNVDHTGPRISLKGDKEITIALGSSFEDPGVNKVSDSSDGKIELDKVIIKSNVKTNKVGKYQIKYSVYDSLENKTEVVRNITVVQELKQTVRNETDNTDFYIGVNPNNYIYFSGMLFRIVDIDGENVRIVSANDIANVNHDGIEEWLDYFYDHVSDNSKKLVVKNKYCQMTFSKEDTKTMECSKYTNKKEVFIPSIVDVNRAGLSEGNYLRPFTMSWLADAKDNSNSWLTRDIFYSDYYDRSYLEFNNKYNFGVRPMLTIKGDTLIINGKGTVDNPYDMGDYERVKAGEYVNKAHSGEYLEINGDLWQVIDSQQDGTTKVIADFSLSDANEYLKISYDENLKSKLYNPTKKGNIGYKINNLTGEYINTKYFVKHEIEVPVYKTEAKYNKEEKLEKYSGKIFAPNMYEMYTAASNSPSLKSYWMINSSKKNSYNYAVSDIGSMIYMNKSEYASYGVRPVAFLNKEYLVVSGSGTRARPYVISK